MKKARKNLPFKSYSLRMRALPSNSKGNTDNSIMKKGKKNTLNPVNTTVQPSTSGQSNLSNGLHAWQSNSLGKRK